MSEGEYSVEASVTDPAGNTATSNDVGEIDLSAPALTVDAPALTSDTTPTIVGTTDAEDGSTVTLVITDSDGNEQTVTATVENGTPDSRHPGWWICPGYPAGKRRAPGPHRV